MKKGIHFGSESYAVDDTASILAPQPHEGGEGEGGKDVYAVLGRRMCCAEA